MDAAMNATALASGSTAALLQAYQDGSLGVSFGIAGFLVGYIAGVAYLLSELGIITPTTKMAGASSGALVSLGLCSGLSADRFMDITQQLCRTCRQNQNCQGDLGMAVASTIQGFLPHDAHQRCQNKAFMSITVGPIPTLQPLQKNMLVTDFTSNADLTAASAASSFIPLWSGRRPTMLFRGLPAFDGFFSEAQPCPPDVKLCIKINSKNPMWNNKNMDEFYAILNRVGRFPLGPIRPARLASLPQSFHAEAAAGEGCSGCRGGLRPQQAAASVNITAALQKAAGLGVDIAPGIFTPTGMSTRDWEELLVLPGDEALNKYLWHLGRRDAQIWARATGLEAAAAARKAGKAGDKQG